MRVIHKKEGWRRRYSINLDRHGYLVVKTNKLCTGSQLQQILARHKIWINRRLKEFETLRQNIKTRSTRVFGTGTKLNLLGDTYTLIVTLEKDRKVTRVTLKGYELHIDSPLKLSSLEVKAHVEAYLRRLAKEIFHDKVAKYAKLYNYKYNRIFIKSQKSKWGSCSSERNLNFNWKLLLCPEAILDYVVIHEVCHLKELNHSSKFWDLVEVECPDYKEKKHWLREHGNEILSQFSS